jgi:hypothetical protein
MAADKIPNFPLEDKNSFYIPFQHGILRVVGAAYNANAFYDEKHKTLIPYLNDAGGSARESDPRHNFIIRADGTVVSRRPCNTLLDIGTSIEKLTILPGDAIIVPERLRVSSKMNDFLQVTQFTFQAALTVAARSVIN